jgi:uncharacterized membrane protein
VTQRLLALHRFSARTQFYALCLCTGVAFAFLAARMYFTHGRTYSFLVWNLFLAWVPYWCSQGVLYLCELKHEPDRRHATGTKIAALAAGWVIFFPNAPYIVTDFKHYLYTPQLTWWYDAGLILSFALAGCFLGVVSLRIMQSLVAKRCGTTIGWAFAISMIGLSGLGIYIGRFLRLNSWDLLLRPHHVLRPIADGFADPFAHATSIGVTLMFAALMLVIYVMCEGMKRET